MSEMTLGTLAVVALLICVVDCFFWMWGGRSGKYKRRYIGSAIQTIGLNGLAAVLGTWVWQMLLTALTEIISRCMGYGGDTTAEKLRRRIVFALGSLCTGAVLLWGLGFSEKALWLFGCQVVAAVVSIILGVKNPLPAAVEEVFVCLSLKYLNYGYIFIGVIA